MPRVADLKTTYPGGAYTDANTPIDMSKYNFIVALAADGAQIDKTQSVAKKSSYVDPAFADRVQEAYDRGIYLGALVRLHFGPGYEYDINNPRENRQINNVCYALDSKTPGKSFHFIIADFETTDTDGNTAIALAHHIEQIRSRYGVRVFLRIAKEQWERYKAFDNLISPTEAPYPLCIPSQAADGIIYTPGQFTPARGLIWERNGRYAWWGDNIAAFTGFVPVKAGGTVPQPDPNPQPNPDPKPPIAGAGYEALVAELRGLREDLRVAIRKAGEALIDIADELGNL